MSDQKPTETKILVDGKEYDAPLGGRLIDFLTSIGKKIPHFCYHPGLAVEASCRQCLVESKGKGPRPPKSSGGPKNANKPMDPNSPFAVLAQLKK